MSRLAPRVRVARVVPARARRSRALARASSADASSSAARVASLRAILGLDDRALRQLDRTVEGRAVRDDVPLGALAERVRALSAALPRACARHAFELVVERPGLLTTDASATRAAIERAANALGGAEQLERLCAECAPAFAHVLWRVGAREGTLAECERPLRAWAAGEDGWHRVFTQRIASEWGYLLMLERMETSVMAGKGVVYRNAKTGESVAFRKSVDFGARAAATDDGRDGEECRQRILCD